jgi:hypothetical protein
MQNINRFLLPGIIPDVSKTKLPWSVAADTVKLFVANGKTENKICDYYF